MHVEDPRWEEYETRFRALAEAVTLRKGPQADLASAQSYLMLYGENGMTVDEEFELLAQFEQDPAALKGLEMLTGYWEDIALYLP